MDHDERMRDVSDKPGGRKGHAKSNTHKIRSSYRPRGAEAVLGQSSSSSRNMVNNRLLLLTSPLFFLQEGPAAQLGFFSCRI